ncbi:DHA2 family efflux MFS transporter permease subunit [Paenibacillus filicis]
MPAQTVRFVPIIVAIFLGTFLSLLNTNTINIALPVLQKEFGTGLDIVQWTLTGFLLALGTAAPVTGYLGERFSYKHLYVASLLGVTLSSVLCALSWNAPMLITFRIVQGAFCGFMVPVAMAMIFQIIPSKQQPIAMSVWIAASTLAPAIGPTYAGWLLQHGSWQWLFWANLPLGLLSMIFAMIYIPYYRMTIPKKFDIWGLLTVIVASSALLMGLSQGHAWGWLSSRTLLFLGSGLLSLGLFVWRELSTDSPLLNLRVLLNLRFTLTAILLSIVMVSFYSGTLLIPIFLQSVQQLSPLDTGIILLPSSAAMALLTLFVGRLYKKTGPMPLMVTGTILLAGGSLPLSWLGVHSSAGYTLVWMIVRYLGLALIMMPAATAGMEQISRELTGHASSLQNWMRNVVGSFGIAIFTSLLAARSASHTAELTLQNTTDPLLIPPLSLTMSINDLNFIATWISLLAIPVAFAIRPSKDSIREETKERSSKAS